MFQVNLAEHNLVFPEGSSFFVACPPKVQREALKLLPYEQRFERTHTSDSGGFLDAHLKANKRDKWKQLVDVGKQLADLGHRVEILPEPPLNHPSRNALLKGYTHHPSNPDYRIDGKYVELKNPESSKMSAVKKNIRKAGRQSDKILINLPDQLSPADMAKIQEISFENYKNLNQISFLHNGDLTVFQREDNTSKK